MKKILIIRFSSIGDIVLTTPVVRCVKQQIDNCEVHYLTKKQFEPILSENPYLDKIFTIDREINEVIRTLAAEKYDYILDLHKNFRSIGVRQKLGVRTFSFPKLNFKKWLLVRFKINLLPSVHIVDRYFKAAERIGVKNDGKGLDYFIPKADEVDPNELPETFRDGYIGFVIGAKHQTKQLPVEKSVGILSGINYPVVILGGPEDRRLGEEIIKNAKGEIFNACGKFSLNRSASLVKQADAVITNDTGLMHIAAAFRKKIFSVWGNTVPEFGMYPYMPGFEMLSEIVQVDGLKCRPCSKIGFEKCPKGHFNCMNMIDEKKIAEKISEYLNL